MAILRCKKCGGTLRVEEGQKIVECEYCMAIQTLPTLDDEKKLKMINRANKLRMECEFDKATTVYENVAAEFPEEAEAYWGLVLSKYGIEYVDDPYTGKKVPTCHRSSYNSIFEDSDFEMVLENADAETRKIYREDAKQIEEIRKGIVEISETEEPYDIFICYKETDENGERTLDSVLAQDIFEELTRASYRVFFARISLEDKIGQQYEPYIFAALHSARIMLVIGTDYEYFNAVWVKNEWSRYLMLIASGEKKVLIPCYKGIDVYDIPKEFQKLQAQDLGKVGATQDLLRGIKNILNIDKPSERFGPEKNIEALLQRTCIYLEDEEWDKADNYCERILDIDPQNAMAYLNKLFATLRIKNLDELEKYEKFDIGDNSNFKRALQYSNPELQVLLNTTYKKHVECLYNRKYEKALELMQNEKLEQIDAAIHILNELNGYKDSDERLQNATNIRKNVVDQEASKNAVKRYQDAVQKYQKAEKLEDIYIVMQKLKEIENSEAAGKLLMEIESRIEDVNKLYEKYFELYQNSTKWTSYYNINTKLKEENNQLEEERKELKSILNSLGMFDFARKRELKAEIYQKDKSIESNNCSIVDNEKSAKKAQNERSLDKELFDVCFELTNECVWIYLSKEKQDFIFTHGVPCGINNVLQEDSDINGVKYNEKKDISLKWHILEKKDDCFVLFGINPIEQKEYYCINPACWDYCEMVNYLSRVQSNFFSKEERKRIMRITYSEYRDLTQPRNILKDLFCVTNSISLMNRTEYVRYRDEVRNRNRFFNHWDDGSWWLLTREGETAKAVERNSLELVTIVGAKMDVRPLICVRFVPEKTEDIGNVDYE